VPDEHAGRRAKCPGCKQPIDIPAASAAGPAAEASPQKASPQEKSAAKPVPSTTQARPVKVAASQTKGDEPTSATTPVKVLDAKPSSKSPGSGRVGKIAVPTLQWHVQTAEGEQYGPVPKDELDVWATEGRLDAECQLLREDWDQWKWADEVYSELAPAGVAVAAAAEIYAIDGPTSTQPGNPFASPAAAASDGGDELVTPGIKRALADTRPWVLFLAILGFISTGFIALIALLIIILVRGAAVFLVIGLIYAGMAALTGFASFYLWSYGSRIGAFLRSSGVKQLQQALVAQKSFWKLVGIVTAISLGLQILVIVLAISLGGLSSFTATP
jgi:hypothetical protein